LAPTREFSVFSPSLRFFPFLFANPVSKIVLFCNLLSSHKIMKFQRGTAPFLLSPLLFFFYSPRPPPTLAFQQNLLCHSPPPPPTPRFPRRELAMCAFLLIFSPGPERQWAPFSGGRKRFVPLSLFIFLFSSFPGVYRRISTKRLAPFYTQAGMNSVPMPL